jgi:hypothetical protein
MRGRASLANPFTGLFMATVAQLNQRMQTERTPERTHRAAPAGAVAIGARHVQQVWDGSQQRLRLGIRRLIRRLGGGARHLLVWE